MVKLLCERGTEKLLMMTDSVSALYLHVFMCMKIDSEHGFALGRASQGGPT